MANVAGHGVDVNELTYSTIESNEAIENTIYDKNVINKKVNVKIKEGTKKGEMFVGVVTRSLKPNRDRFPHSIKFDPKDNLKDEQVDKIPDASDGITMYVEPESESEPSTRSTRNKGNKGNKGNKSSTRNKGNKPKGKRNKKR
jgi:hypothetical protein